MRFNSRLATTLLMITSTVGTLAALGSAAYWRGQQSEPLTRFLYAGFSPLVDEAFLSYPVEYALRSNEANDVIFLGDSTCHDDIDPARLRGFRSYNLGSLGSIGPLGILLTPNGYLSHHPKPRAAVLCVRCASRSAQTRRADTSSADSWPATGPRSLELCRSAIASNTS